jgi:hypothetical protein
VTLIDITQPLEDTRALLDMSVRTGLTPEEVKRVLAHLDGMRIDQVIRLCRASESERVRRVNRTTRRGTR